MELSIGQILTHVLAFLLLFWVLRKIAWKPLLSVMEERRKKISGEFDRVDKLQQEVDNLRLEYQSRLAKIEAEARQKILEGLEEGKRFGAELVAKSRDDAQKIISQAQAKTELEIARAKEELRSEIVRLALAACEKMLAEKLDDQQHRRMIDRFITEVQKQ